MKKLSLLLFVTLLAISCSSKKEEPVQEVIKPIKTAKAETKSLISKNYAGVVVSDQTTTLAFKVGGQVINKAVRTGDQVKAGQLLVELDTRDLDLQHEVNRSAYVTAKSQYERYKRLLEKGAVSQQDYEIAETNYDKARGALDNSENKLKDTKLYAPFAGTIENTFVSEYQEISIGEPILRLVNTEQFYVQFNLADYSLQALKKGKPEFFVKFGNISNRYYKASLREYTDISTDGTGIPITVWVDDPEFNNVIKPGFSCDVKVDFYFEDNNGSIVVPITAVFVDFQTGKTCVMVVNNNIAKKREVVVRQLEGKDYAEITQGLEVGETVVTSGAVTLKDGQKVKVIN